MTINIAQIKSLKANIEDAINFDGVDFRSPNAHAELPKRDASTLLKLMILRIVPNADAGFLALWIYNNPISEIIKCCKSV